MQTSRYASVGLRNGLSPFSNTPAAAHVSHTSLRPGKDDNSATAEALLTVGNVLEVCWDVDPKALASFVDRMCGYTVHHMHLRSPLYRAGCSHSSSPNANRCRFFDCRTVLRYSLEISTRCLQSGFAVHVLYRALLLFLRLSYSISSAGSSSSSSSSCSPFSSSLHRCLSVSNSLRYWRHHH